MCGTSSFSHTARNGGVEGCTSGRQIAFTSLYKLNGSWRELELQWCRNPCTFARYTCRRSGHWSIPGGISFPHFVHGAGIGAGSAAVTTVPHVEQSQLRLRMRSSGSTISSGGPRRSITSRSGFHGSRCSRDERPAPPALAAFQVRRGARHRLDMQTPLLTARKAARRGRPARSRSRPPLEIGPAFSCNPHLHVRAEVQSHRTDDHCRGSRQRARTTASLVTRKLIDGAECKPKRELLSYPLRGQAAKILAPPKRRTGIEG